ncbi:MAG: L,D-transpeptidase [Candidatus Levybacteria bacterium]|nr:L,D-transpeptidase [Candidatus Levybacteria bacterium]
MRRFLIFAVAFLFAFSVFTNTARAQIFTTEKLITIDIGKQMIYAWDGGALVNQSLISTGMYWTPTVKGDFKIWYKTPLQNMKGNYPPYEPYFIKNVPNVMYFYKDYAIHGAWWHNAFGSKYTHGCVNEPVAFSKWLYDWAPIGTRVVVF